MNERQAFSAIRNMLRLERQAQGAVQKITPDLRRAFEYLKIQVESMPTGQLEREIWFKNVSGQFAGAFRDANARIYQEVNKALEDGVVEQYDWASKYLRDGGVDLTPAAGQGPVGSGVPSGVPTPTQLRAITQKTEVLGKRLDQLFGTQDDGTSVWTKTQLKSIDRVVKQGFLLSETNEEIAKNLAYAMNGSVREVRAIARTAVMDMSQRAHNDFWDANKDRIAGWEFDASMDDRVCPTCAPFDGRTAKERGLLPTTPVHVNCRCRLLPLTRTELALREAEGPQRRTVTELVDAPSKEAAEKIAKDKFGATQSRAYAKQVRGPDGKKYWRVASDVTRKDHPLTMGEFIKEASPATQKKVLGPGRAKRFNNLISPSKGNKGALSPDAALARVTKDVRPAFREGTRSVLESPAVKGLKKKKAPVVKVPAASKSKAAVSATKPTQTKKLKGKLSLQEQINAKEKEFKALNYDVLNASPKEMKVAAEKAKKAKAELEALKLQDPNYAKQQAAAKKAKEKQLKSAGEEVTNKELPPALAKARPPRDALSEYTSENYRQIRAEQFREAQRAGKTLTPYERAQVDIFEKNKVLANDAADIESFLKRAPKHKGTVYRTVNVPKADLDDLLAGLSDGRETLAMESWTKDAKLQFAVGEEQRVKLQVKNKRGVDISQLSVHEKEQEVLMPRGSRYTVKSVKQEEISPSMSKKGVYRWIVDLEQL